MKSKVTKAAPAAKAKAKKGEAKVTLLVNNAKVRVVETRFKPGDLHTHLPYDLARVSRVLSGGTLLRTHADGKAEKLTWKTGEVRFFDPAKTASRKIKQIENIGNTEVVLYIVMLK